MVTSANAASGVKFTSLIDYAYIFCPHASKKEGDEYRKILHFHPQNTRRDTQLNYVGFAEAGAKYTEQFNKDASHHTPHPPSPASSRSPHFEVNTERYLIVIVRVEKDFYSVVNISRQKCAKEKYALHPPAIYQVLLTAYSMFKLFFGDFQSKLMNEADVVDDGDVYELLRERLDYFYTRYFATLKLHLMPLLDVYNAVEYSRPTSDEFTRVHTMLATVTHELPIVEHVVVLHNDKMVYHTLAEDDIAVVYRYLTHNLLPMSLRADLQHTGVRADAHPSSGKFVTGPTSLDGDGDVDGVVGKLPIVFVTAKDGASPQEYNMVVYRAVSTSITLFVPVERMDTSILFFRKVDKLLGERLTSIGTHLLETSTTERPPTDFYYVYYDPSTRAVRTNCSGLMLDADRERGVHTETIQLLCQLRDEISTSEMGEIEEGDDFVSEGLAGNGELLCKSPRDVWVYARTINERHINLLLLQPETSSLLDANQRVTSIIAKYFNHHFTAALDQLLTP